MMAAGFLLHLVKGLGLGTYASSPLSAAPTTISSIPPPKAQLRRLSPSHSLLPRSYFHLHVSGLEAKYAALIPIP